MSNGIVASYKFYHPGRARHIQNFSSHFWPPVGNLPEHEIVTQFWCSGHVFNFGVTFLILLTYGLSSMLHFIGLIQDFHPLV